MPLSSTQQTIAKNYMKIHINPVCSCCKESKFEVMDILESMIYSNGDTSTEGASLLILATACDNCGEMKFYPAKKVGLI